MAGNDDEEDDKKQEERKEQEEEEAIIKRLHMLFFKSLISHSKDKQLRNLQKEFEFQNIDDQKDDILDVEEVKEREYNRLKGYMA